MSDRPPTEMGNSLPVLAYGYREERFGRHFHRISKERPDGSYLELVSKADALKQIHAITQRLEAAEALAEQYRRDAGRYRWLRQQHEDRPYAVFGWDDDCCMHGEELDATIDAAIAKGGKSL